MYRHCVRVVLFFVTIPVICVSMYVEGDRGTGARPAVLSFLILYQSKIAVVSTCWPVLHLSADLSTAMFIGSISGVLWPLVELQ